MFLTNLFKLYSRNFIYLGLLSLILPAVVCGQSDPQFPVKPITVIVPYNAGGGTDIHARLVANYWGKTLGKPVVVANKAGGAGSIGHREIANSAPDGYTVGAMSFPDGAVITGLKGEEAGYTINDFIVLGCFTRTPAMLAVKQGHAAKNIKEFVEHAKKNPGKVTVGVSGDTFMLDTIRLEEAAGIQLNPIVFQGAGQSFTALLGGHVDAVFISFLFAVTGKDKGVSPLALLGEKRVEGFPALPTFKEQGYDIFDETSRIFCVPKNTPQPIVKKLSESLAALSKDPEFVEKVTATGELYWPVFGDDLAKYYSVSAKSWADLAAKNRQRMSQ